MFTPVPHAHRQPQSRPAVRAAACPGGGAEPGRERRARELSQFALCVAEVLAGHRDPVHLRDRMTGRAYQALRRRAGGYATPVRPRLGRAHLRCPAPGITEVSAVVVCGGRHRALALRVDWMSRAWLCTRLETDLGR
ncbi:Rv3235 family protein [Marinactinospora thermotolerans]|uniref:Uncharacterized protein n=1 Tax=Marinactinospora thermotolerans DSM 45154 TaxID=1122192 RepID=A0A1T4JYD8_9ACTN|nr:Rv3235 family protein [Marinactinospora thermotolerans]SJZ35148.1 hypothetical protein SAMN02745673_00059 [Marinactinospora thermotolerans DSM 45154]